MPGKDLQAEIEQRLASAEPDIEVLLAEQVSDGKIRLFIDRAVAELRTTFGG